jgi:Ca-activated chloride channel family protein
MSCADRLDSNTVRRLGTAALVMSLALAVPAAGQFTSGVNVVEVYASVTGAQGEPIQGLARGDFEVREDGVPQTLSVFAEGDFPLSVAVAVDASFSMAGTRLELARSAARIFLGELRPADEAMVVAIGSEVETLAPLSKSRRAQLDAVARVDAFGTTALYDAIIGAIDAVQPAQGRRALVLLSDGDDRYSTASADTALDRARRSDVMVYPIALGRQRPELFAELATLTGGRSFHARDARGLPDIARGIARDLRHQYLLGYTPSRAIEPGRHEWRSISVTVTRPGARVRARDGYVVR